MQLQRSFLDCYFEILSSYRASSVSLAVAYAILMGFASGKVRRDRLREPSRPLDLIVHLVLVQKLLQALAEDRNCTFHRR